MSINVGPILSQNSGKNSKKQSKSKRRCKTRVFQTCPLCPLDFCPINFFIQFSNVPFVFCFFYLLIPLYRLWITMGKSPLPNKNSHAKISFEIALAQAPKRKEGGPMLNNRTRVSETKGFGEGSHHHPPRNPLGRLERTRKRFRRWLQRINSRRLACISDAKTQTL